MYIYVNKDFWQISKFDTCLKKKYQINVYIVSFWSIFILWAMLLIWLSIICFRNFVINKPTNISGSLLLYVFHLFILIQYCIICILFGVHSFWSASYHINDFITNNIVFWNFNILLAYLNANNSKLIKTHAYDKKKVNKGAVIVQGWQSY